LCVSYQCNGRPQRQAEQLQVRKIFGTATQPAGLTGSAPVTSEPTDPLRSAVEARPGSGLPKYGTPPWLHRRHLRCPQPPKSGCAVLFESSSWHRPYHSTRAVKRVLIPIRMAHPNAQLAFASELGSGLGARVFDVVEVHRHGIAIDPGRAYPESIKARAQFLGAQMKTEITAVIIQHDSEGIRRYLPQRPRVWLAIVQVQVLTIDTTATAPELEAAFPGAH
jgi:hypothetical protein